MGGVDLMMQQQAALNIASSVDQMAPSYETSTLVKYTSSERNPKKHHGQTLTGSSNNVQRHQQTALTSREKLASGHLPSAIGIGTAHLSNRTISPARLPSGQHQQQKVSSLHRPAQLTPQDAVDDLEENSQSHK